MTVGTQALFYGPGEEKTEMAKQPALACAAGPTGHPPKKLPTR